MTSTLVARVRAATREGRPLPDNARLALEAGLGSQLSAVRVHTGSAADSLARALGAEAVTCGTDIVFRSGAFRPDTTPGMRLLAHETVHVLQQSRGVVGGTRCGGMTVSVPGDPWEREADGLAAAVVAGRQVGAGSGWTTPGRDFPATALQRHVSFEHRLLGDGPTTDLVAVSSGGSGRQQFLSNQIALLELWQSSPTAVTEQQVQGLCPWIRTVRLGADSVLATYGELNALPDYLADAESFDQLPAGVLLPILQVIRQEGYNQLTDLLTGSNPNVTFADAACAPWRLTMLNTLLETQALDVLTFGLGARGEDHYQGLLARNSCHFAPFSWYRWQSSHLIARDLAAQAHAAGGDAALTHQAWTFHGYADHFLQDSFAAGHLVNKTLVMQWFIEWAAGQSLLPVADWDAIAGMTTSAQPGLAGLGLYDPSYPGPSNDPQTAQEATTLVSRILASGVSGAPGDAQLAAYECYLTFLTSAAAQLASANLHDHYNANSLWVSSLATTTPYEVWGDDTLFTGSNGAKGVQETSAAAQMSQQALGEILATGSTSIDVGDIRGHFPTRAGSAASSLQDLETWNTTQKASCTSSFGAFGPVLKTLLLGLASPRLGIVSQDQSFASIWSTSLPRAGYVPVTTLLAGGRLFAASNGYAYELDPASGSVLHSVLVTSSVGAGDYGTRLATDGSTLFVGVHGYVYGIDLEDWTGTAWHTSVGGTGFQPVDVLVEGSSLYAGSNGYVYEIDRHTGKVTEKLLLASILGTGDYRTRLTTDGRMLFAGTHGYVYGVDLGSWKAKWNRGVGGTGYHPVSVLSAGGRLYAGCNGYVYSIDPHSGSQQHSLLVSSSVGVGDYDTRIATDGKMLFAGAHGYAYGIDLGSWKMTWDTGVGGTGYHPVHLLVQGERLFAGSNGYAYRLDPATGTVKGSLLLTYILGVGDFETGLASDGVDLYAGVHGFANKIIVNDLTLDGTMYHDWLTGDGAWHGWARPHHGAPAGVTSVTAAMGATGNLEVFATTTGGILYHTWLAANGTWSRWTAGFDGAPADVTSVTAASGPLGSLEIFATTAGGTLYHNGQTRHGWSGWAPDFDGAPAGVTSVCAVLGWSDNVEVFATTAEGVLYHDRLTSAGTWDGWTADFDGAPTGVTSVTAATGPTRNLEVFAVTADGTLHHDWLTPDGAWNGWTSNFDGAPAGVTSVTAALGRANLEVFAMTTAGTLYHDWLTPGGAWNGWTADFGGAPHGIASVTAAIGTTDNLEVFAVTSGGDLYHTWLARSGTWNPWTPHFDGAPHGIASVTAAIGTTGNLEVFATTQVAAMY